MSPFNIPKMSVVGYHSECGFPIYPSDFIKMEWVSVPELRATKESINIYKCIKCKINVREDELIPF
jgi:hypothetical protein